MFGLFILLEGENNVELLIAAFVDVSPEETFQKNAFENFKETTDLDSSKVPLGTDSVTGLANYTD